MNVWSSNCSACRLSLVAFFSLSLVAAFHTPLPAGPLPGLFLFNEPGAIHESGATPHPSLREQPVGAKAEVKFVRSSRTRFYTLHAY